MVSGWIILDKPLGLGSTQAVAAVKRNCREAGLGKVKVGHGGTLDPLATGVLPIALGEATKLCGRMLEAHKTYQFTVAFGSETDTLDGEGRVVRTNAVRPTPAHIAAVLSRFTGAISQVPPAYSALKIEGERAYDLARAGEAFELAARAVTIYALEILPHGGGGTMRGIVEGECVFPQTFSARPAPSTGCGGPPPPGGEDFVTLLATVSKGTYIRSLARDIAYALGTVGHVTHLRRRTAGPFAIEQAISLDRLNEIGKGAALENVLLPLEAGLVDIPALDLGPEQAGAVRQGRVLTGLAFQDGLYWARWRHRPIALVQLSGGCLSVERGFNLPDVAEQAV